ncbi:MAG TPA: HypC/HybG/HupF family hydrogenase formation chaperone [Desulfotomaculum sp.]|nr:MAG: hydrogenase assembly protein HypC [Peptococcaceae bacterium BRH_c8a]KJS75525.1 MAG: hydrogenase assembly protein HypC [Desulfotomaculum sp. BICA1-6]HBX23259.1 HypC/HybG/HupF family hydrogenase formation chaperone [Desulfotomaculum sp.]
MCLGIPVKIVELPDEHCALVEIDGIRRKVGLQLVGNVSPGDYLMVHAGFAVEVLDLAEAEARIKLWEEFLKFEGAGQA